MARKSPQTGDGDNNDFILSEAVHDLVGETRQKQPPGVRGRLFRRHDLARPAPGGNPLVNIKVFPMADIRKVTYIWGEGGAWGCMLWNMAGTSSKQQRIHGGVGASPVSG